MDETLRVLFSKFEELSVQVTEIKTILIKTVVVNQEHNTERLDRHRSEINKAFKEIDEIRNEIKNTKEKAVTLKNFIIGIIALAATVSGTVSAIVNLWR